MNTDRVFRVFFMFIVLFVSIQPVCITAQTIKGHALPNPVRPLAPRKIPRTPVVALPVASFKLLGSGTGWASTGSRLLWTSDTGLHWKDISPPNPRHDRYADVFFLDANTGWVLFVSAAGNNRTSNNQWEVDWAFYVSATTDGGRTWTKTHVQIPASGTRTPSLNENGKFTFSDRLHGWLLLEHQSGSAFSFGSLFATSDGGRTWQLSKGNPGFYGDIRAFPNGDLWALDRNSLELVVSRAGEVGFEEFSAPTPEEVVPAADPLYSLPIFEDGLHGYEAVTYEGGSGAPSVAVLFNTVDGGRTWEPDRALSGLIRDDVVQTTVADSMWILPFAPRGSQPSLITIRPNDRVTAPSHQGSADFRQCNISFAKSNEGWMDCSGELSATTDGGTSWTSITPRFRDEELTEDPATPVWSTSAPINHAQSRIATLETSPHIPYVSGIEQRVAFDKDYILSPAAMSTWWGSSPYYDVGIYLPGSPSGPTNAPTAKHPNRILLDSDWIDSIISSGWGIIPIWSGLQPPCTVELHRHQFSTDPDTAEAQGQAQADAAYTSANDLGLDGTIIYLDIEEYDHSTCGTAVQSYLAGWIAEMHLLAGAGSAGVYGNQDVASLDLTGADAGYITRADNHVTVWGLNHYSGSGLADAPAWTDKQRIHQYRIDHSESWGGSGPFNVDEDVVDARIVPSSQFKAFIPANPLIPADYDSSDILSLLLGISNGINNSGFSGGTAVGVFAYPPSTDGVQARGEDGYIWSAGTSTLLSIGNGMYTGGSEAEGVNNLGQIVGYYYGNDSIAHGFLYSQSTGSYITMDQGSIGTQLYSINDSGWILGAYKLDSEGDVGCILFKPSNTGAYTPTTYTDSSGQCGATGINGIGQIAGSYQNTSYTGYIDDAEAGTPGNSGNILTFSLPAYTYSGSINNNGVIAAGSYILNPDGSILYSDETGLESFLAINDEMQVAGYYYSDVESTLIGMIQDSQH